jgi:glycosyltransferase involved in cell wall biosynthesis
LRRVLLVSATAKRGGAERALAALVRRLPATGWEPLTVLLEPGPLEEWLAGSPICHIPNGERTGARIAELARGCDVVLTNKWRGQLAGGPGAMLAGRPCVWWQQDFPDASPPELLDGSVDAQVVVCSSDAVLAEQQRAAPRLRAVKVPLGVAVDELAAARGSGAKVRAELNAADRPLARIVARLAPDKRQDRFLHAAARVAAARPDTLFVVIGGEILGAHGNYADGLAALATRLGIGDRVVFAGHRADVYAWIDALDVLVHPAEREPFGLVVVEALALGARVVAIDAAGPGEILAGDPRAELVATADGDLLAGAMARALDQAPATGGSTAFSDTRMATAFGRLFDEVAA